MLNPSGTTGRVYLLLTPVFHKVGFFIATMPGIYVNIHFPCSDDHVQDWQPYPVDPYSCYMCDHTYMFY